MTKTLDGFLPEQRRVGPQLAEEKEAALAG